MVLGLNALASAGPCWEPAGAAVTVTLLPQASAVLK